MASTQIRGTTQIQAGTIVDAQIAPAAAIQLTKLAKVPITPDGATPFTAAQSMGSNKITSLADPTVATDAATKNYVDNVAQGLSTKTSVRALAAANITLSGTQTVDGVALSTGDTVLCIAQTTGSQNGSYTVASGAWTRTLDFDDVNDQTRSPYWFVGEGTVYAASGWVMTTWPYTIGTTALSFTQFTGAGEIIAGNGLQKSGNTLSINTAVTVDISTAQTLTNKSLAATSLTGILAAAQFPALTGDVTNTAGSLATTISGGAVTLAKMANLGANTVIGNATGSSAAPSAVPLLSTPTASAVMIRDANGNVQVNNKIENVTTTATAAGTTTLSVASAANQQFTGSSTQTVVMPNATTLANGQAFYLTNRSTGAVTVNMNGGSLLQTLAASSFAFFILINNGTAAGTWDVSYSSPAAVSTDAGNIATLGSDNLILVSQSQIWSVRLRSFNAIQNPNFEVDQRNVYTTLTNIATATYIQDRWSLGKSGTMTVNTQAATPAAGNEIVIPGTNFEITARFLSVTLTGQEATLGAGDWLYIQQIVEGPSLRELFKDVHSFSILARSSVANLKFGLSLRDPPTISRSLTKLCTLGAANTWTLISLPNLPVWPSAGNFTTVSGNEGYRINIALACGSTYMSPANDTWQTGNFLGALGQDNFAAQAVNSTFQLAFVQHEPGSQCTTLIDKPFSQNLDECLRYYQKSSSYAVAPLSSTMATLGWLSASSTTARSWIQFKKPMAKVPTIATTGNTTAVNQVFLETSAANVAVSNYLVLDGSIVNISLSSAGPATAGNVLGTWSADTGW